MFARRQRDIDSSATARRLKAERERLTGRRGKERGIQRVDAGLRVVVHEVDVVDAQEFHAARDIGIARRRAGLDEGDDRATRRRRHHEHQLRAVADRLAALRQRDPVVGIEL